ncbi:hypothetical protein DCAR_0623534 [Daucus carota subsp. sativus]|uniref:Uncharacterized protein n=1 Tax=Daucus carota subsp. sativus TaxID=79200 RepID=A0AAF0XD52_DAUCS|nr:hypothetical protein DCAR_0623534 [Daucus carota subsp. sativus]
MIALWKNFGQVQINQKAAEPLADPEDYPNLFEDWQLALGIESKVAEIRNTIPPAAKYVNHMHKSNVNRLEAFRNMYVDEEEPHQNGDLDHELKRNCGANLFFTGDPSSQFKETKG